jgi:hypothetical protein
MKMLPQVVADQTEVVLFGGGEGLAPLRLAQLKPGEALPFHIFTAADGVPGEFVLTWRRGRALPAKARDMVWLLRGGRGRGGSGLTLVPGGGSRGRDPGTPQAPG